MRREKELGSHANGHTSVASSWCPEPVHWVPWAAEWGLRGLWDGLCPQIQWWRRPWKRLGSTSMMAFCFGLQSSGLPIPRTLCVPSLKPSVVCMSAVCKWGWGAEGGFGLHTPIPQYGICTTWVSPLGRMGLPSSSFSSSWNNSALDS